MPHPLIDFLRHQRRSQGVTGVQMAEHLGISQPMVSNIELGKNTLFQHVVNMADRLGVDIVGVLRTGDPLSERDQRILSLMREVLPELPEHEREIWLIELEVRRRQLGLDEPTRRTR